MLDYTTLITVPVDEIPEVEFVKEKGCSDLNLGIQEVPEYITSSNSEYTLPNLCEQIRDEQLKKWNEAYEKNPNNKGLKYEGPTFEKIAKGTGGILLEQTVGDEFSYLKIATKALKNDRQGAILSFLNFIEKVYTECPTYVHETANNWVIYQSEDMELSEMNFPKERYSRHEAVALFNLIVYGKIEE